MIPEAPPGPTPLPISEAKLAANRANGLKSKGPKSTRGKEISRRNALKHGMVAELLDLRDAVPRGL